MNKTRVLFISMLVVVVLIFAIAMGFILTEEMRAKNKVIDSTKKAASKVKKSDKKEFKNIDVDKYLKLYDDNKKSVVLIGRSDCEFCKIAEPILQSMSKKYDIDINYLSTDGFDDEDRTNLLNSDEYFQESEGMPTPLLLIVGKSKIIDKVEGLVEEEEYKDFFNKNNII
ncbi:MAG: conjugal transfer protein TraF [Bacilli bacterium]|nr:conjugal transfer protein TraF [Bacilli bacterium]